MWDALNSQFLEEKTLKTIPSEPVLVNINSVRELEEILDITILPADTNQAQNNNQMNAQQHKPPKKQVPRQDVTQY